MLLARKVALKVLPLVVVAWAILALLGSAWHLVNESDLDQGATAKAGIGLCAVSVALLVAKRARRLVPSAPVAHLYPARASLYTSCPEVLRGPPPSGPPIFLLLRVSRT